MAIGSTLLLFRGVLPDHLTIIVANTLTTLSPNLYYIAVSRFSGQKHSLALALSLVSINAFLLYFYTYVSDNIAARIISVSLLSAFGTYLVVKQIWNIRKSGNRFSVMLAVIPFGIYGVLLVISAILAALSPPTALFSNSPIESATYILLFIISFLWTIGFILMISQRLQADLTELATIDKVTRIPNRHVTQSLFGKELSRIERDGGEFAILLIDLDNFKQVNDKYGHTVGDIALLKTAQIFQSAIRKEDIVGRWGGEEFLVILPNTPIENAHILAESIRNDISTADIKTPSGYVKLTVSIGVASSKHATTMDDLLKKAGDALYAAKAIKDTVVLAN